MLAKRSSRSQEFLMSSIFYYAFFLILQNFSSFIISNAPAAEPLTIITEEWPPFNYTENGVLKGFSTEVVQLVMKDLNVTAHIMVLPGPRVMQQLNQYKRSMFFSLILTSERKPQYKWIGPIAEQSIYFYKKKGSALKIHSLNDAKNVSSICTREYGLIFNTLKKEGFKNLDVSNNPESIYLKTIKGRCDLAIGETPLGVVYLLKKTNQAPDSLEQTSLKLLRSSLYIAASKDIPDAEIARWQKSLDKIKASHIYSVIHQKYKN